MVEKKYLEKDILNNAKKAYQQGCARFKVDPKKCALLVIDMQDEFVKPYSSPYWIPDATKQVPLIKKLIEHCRYKKIPVIYTIYSDTHNYLDRPKTREDMPIRFLKLELESDLFFKNGHVWHEISPKNNEIVIQKPSYGAFWDTPLDTILKKMEKDTVIICGTMTNYCCGVTARQAYERSYKVVFGSDITSTDDPDLQEPELMVLRKGFAKVLSLDEILELLK